MPGHHFRGPGNALRLCFCDETVCHPTGHIGADANDCSPASGKSFFLERIGGTGVGDIHGDKTVGRKRKGADHGSAAVGFLSAAAHKIQIDIQRGVPKQFSGPQKSDKARTVIQCFAADAASQKGAKRFSGHNKGSHQSFPLFLGQSGVNIQIRQWSAPVGVAYLLNMGGQDSHKTKLGGLGEDDDFPVGKHPRVYPTNRAKAEKAVFGAGDHQANLIQVGVQHHPFGVFRAATPNPNHISETIFLHFIHQGTQQFHRLAGHGVLPSRGARAAAKCF